MPDREEVTTRLMRSIGGIDLREIGCHSVLRGLDASGRGRAECIGERARLARASLDQHCLRIGVGSGRALLGAGRNGGDQVDEMFDHLAGKGRVVAEICAQQRQVDDDITVKQAGGQLGVEETGGARFAGLTREVVDDGEVIALAGFLMDCKGMCDMDGRIRVRSRIGRHHAAEKRGFKSGLQHAVAAQRGKIGLLALLEQMFGCFTRRLGIDGA